MIGENEFKNWVFRDYKFWKKHDSLVDNKTFWMNVSGLSESELDEVIKSGVTQASQGFLIDIKEYLSWTKSAENGYISNYDSLKQEIEPVMSRYGFRDKSLEEGLIYLNALYIMYSGTSLAIDSPSSSAENYLAHFTLIDNSNFGNFVREKLRNKDTLFMLALIRVATSFDRLYRKDVDTYRHKSGTTEYPEYDVKDKITF